MLIFQRYEMKLWNETVTSNFHYYSTVWNWQETADFIDHQKIWEYSCFCWMYYYLSSYFGYYNYIPSVVINIIAEAQFLVSELGIIVLMPNKRDYFDQSACVLISNMCTLYIQLFTFLRSSSVQFTMHLVYLAQIIMC